MVQLWKKKSDLAKLSKLIYSIEIELKLLDNKVQEISNKEETDIDIKEIYSIKDKLTGNLDSLKLMLEYEDEEIEVLDDNDEKEAIEILNDEQTKEIEILDDELAKTELLDDLTKEIELLDDELAKTELLDDLSDKVNNFNSKKEDELKKLQYMENTIKLNLNTISERNNEITKQELVEFHEELKQDLTEVNDKIKVKIKHLKLKKFIWTILVSIFSIILITVLIIVMCRLFNSKKVNNEIKNIEKLVTEEQIETDKQELAQENNEYIKYINTKLLVNFSELKNKNSDVKAWIKLNNTNINYPIVQSTDNDFYLYHSYDKKYSHMGWIFMDYRNDSELVDKNTIIYGHGLLDGNMFGSLRNVFNDSWYKNPDNQIIEIYTEKGFMLYEIFSIYTIEPEEYYIKTKFETTEDYADFLSVIISRSNYNFNKILNVNDRIITLSTCYDNQKRAVVHGRLIFSSEN